ncbi:MAG: GNAT family N-acetyltransferase [Alphaproteobacteria bacterium]|nr:GNAT family N-acetyltransferase [Alphaproteobacteria bacterium]
MAVRALDVDPEVWSHALAAARFVPLQQSAAYGTALRKRGRSVRSILVESDGRFTLGIQAATRRVVGLPLVTTALRGPFAFDGRPAPAPEELRAALAAVSGPWPQLLVVSPDFDDTADARAALTTSGCREVMTSAAVARLALGGDARALRARLDQKWRNRLVRAEAARLAVDVTRGGAALDWLLNAHERLMRAKGFKGLPAGFVLDLLASSARRDVFVVIAQRGKSPVAAAAFLRHGPTATYLIAATEAEGRAVHAGTLVLWRGALALQESGAHDCDLGLLDTSRSAGLARFKLGTGATLARLCGTWTPSWL